MSWGHPHTASDAKFHPSSRDSVGGGRQLWGPGCLSEGLKGGGDTLGFSLL